MQWGGRGKTIKGKAVCLYYLPLPEGTQIKPQFEPAVV